MEVAPGVRWVRMPLPFSLKWINLWLLEDGDGWTVVDTGIPNSRDQGALANDLRERAAGQAGEARSSSRTCIPTISGSQDG